MLKWNLVNQSTTQLASCSRIHSLWLFQPNKLFTLVAAFTLVKLQLPISCKASSTFFQTTILFKRKWFWSSTCSNSCLVLTLMAFSVGIGVMIFMGQIWIGFTLTRTRCYIRLFTLVKLRFSMNTLEMVAVNSTLSSIYTGIATKKGVLCSATLWKSAVTTTSFYLPKCFP